MRNPVRLNRDAAILPWIASLALGLTGQAAMAQAERTQQVPICAIVANDILEGQLVAICKGQGLILGPADSFQVFENRGLETTVVDLTKGGERRVLMISFPGGELLLEDLTVTLAKSAGRGPMMGMKGITIDLGSFESNGEIGVSDTAGTSGRINLGQQIAAEASRRGGNSAKN